MTRPDRAGIVIAAGLAGLAALIAWQTSQIPVGAAYARVGPKTFPYVIAAGLAVLAAGTLLAALRGPGPEREADRLVPIAWIVGGLVAQMVLIRPLGFSIATGVLFAMVAKGFGRGPLWITVPVGIAFALLVWLIFARGLSLSLPAGFLEDRVS